ncbi:2-hydroxyacid dehydrogenase [Pseudomonas fluorescens HK44]|uniref:2-hydroxyacid dehydrogenase n=1 Tax=Pseudomonas fluorescens HK44 TaxID=1042209 RepID=A0A010SQ33_PSEFL|nr:2-hydroxyacid dehydrogenase [Pseudomonas fluorescens HK44]
MVIAAELGADRWRPTDTGGRRDARTPGAFFADRDLRQRCALWCAGIGDTGLDALNVGCAPFEQADVLSIHLVLSERSRGLVDEQALGWMKPSALLINTARGPIVDEAALLIHALEQNRLKGAALDVFEREPLAADHPFRTLPNVLATPHVGYVSEQNYRLFFSQMIEDIQAWTTGHSIRMLN